jgi:hypothetical protein
MNNYQFSFLPTFLDNNKYNHNRYMYMCVCVCVFFNIILILAEIPSKWILYFNFQHQNLLQNNFTLYVLLVSRNILIFIEQRVKYCQQYKSQSISPFKPHPPPFTSYPSAKYKKIVCNYSVVFVLFIFN